MLKPLKKQGFAPKLPVTDKLLPPPPDPFHRRRRLSVLQREGSQAERQSSRPCAEVRALRCQFRRKISFR
jgi:hypothetical protein